MTQVLEQQSRARSLPARQVERARIVLRAADGWRDKEIAAELGITPEKAARWRDRFLDDGLEVLERTGLTGPAAVGHIVRSALARAGVVRSGRGAAHLFRHGLGTRMIRKGASISEIADVLRHRSQGTTGTYTQVAFETLRRVAQPWPRMGSVL